MASGQPKKVFSLLRRHWYSGLLGDTGIGRNGSAIVGSSEFQEVVAYALEGTLFNLVNEVTHGEFSLDVMPRQVVRALDIQ